MADLNQVRQGLLEIDIAVHTSWKLGKNMVVGWMPDDSGIQVCLAPCYRVLGQATASPRLLNGRRMMGTATFAEACKILQVRPLKVSVPLSVRVVLGSNGEFPSFTLEERRRIAVTAAAARSGLTMILGVGSCAIGEVVEMVDEAARLGYDAVLCPPPFYFRKPSTRGLVEFYGRVLDASQVAVLAYHIPHLTGIPIDDELLDMIGGHPRLAGVKDSTGDPSELRRFVGRCAGRSYFVGSDRLVLAARDAGGSGSITAAASIVPALAVEAARGSHGQEALARVRGLLEEFGLQAAVKALLRHRGFGHYGSRPPLVGLERDPERLLS